MIFKTSSLSFPLPFCGLFNDFGKPSVNHFKTLFNLMKKSDFHVRINN